MSTLDLSGTDHTIRMATSFDVATHKGRFAARFDHLRQGLAVMCTETTPGTWYVSTYPGLPVMNTTGDGSNDLTDVNKVKYIFHGGSTWEVTDANLATALNTAGYTVY